ncbi:MAG: outer membrane beta-barrel protein [Saprospiraceae bacterium]
MKKVTRLLLFFLLTSVALQAQRYDLVGTLVADDSSLPLEAATIMLLSAKDSSLVNFGRSDEKGFFEIKSISNKDAYLLRITYVGYQTYDQQILASVAENPYNVGTIRLQQVSLTLNEAVVKAEHIPVQIKKDTIEFNAQAFKTQENDDVEALLRKLPGVDVGSDGNVTAQGQNVQRIFVDGKEFFGNDPKIALKNLPAKAIDKVQVFDRKSDQATFSGIDDGVREKTLNLTLKKDHKKGLFGSASAGYGTDERYEGRLSLNRFREEEQLSIVAMGNNVNRQGFSVQDYMSFTGMARNMGRGGAVRITFNGDNNDLPLDFGNNNTGFTTTWAGGLNFSNTFNNKKTEVTGSYFFNNADRFVESDRITQNFLANGTFTENRNSAGTNLNTSHRLNVTLDHKIDSLNSLKLTTRLGYSESDRNSNTFSQALNGSNDVQNESTNRNISEGTGTNLNSELIWRHRFNKKGRTLSTTFTLGLNDSERNGELEAVNRFFTGATPRIDSIMQTNLQDNNTFNYGANASYTEPLGKRKYLEFNYAFNQNNNDQNREVYDINNGERFFNNNLSNKFDNMYTYHRGGTNFKINKTDWNFNVGLQLQQTEIDGQLLLQDVNIRRSFTNILPNIRFNKEFTSTKNIRFDYETNVNEPSIDQLSPVIDNTDPLNIYVGNPSLRPEYAHRLSANYATFNPGTFRNFFANINFTYTQNRIQNAQTVDNNFARTTQPINVDNDYQVNGFLNFGFPIKRPYLSMNLNTNTIWMRGFNLINDVENQTERLIANTGARLTFRYKELLEWMVTANLSYNQTHYSLQQSLNQDFLNQTYGTELNLNLPGGFVLASTLNYQIYNSINGNGTDQEVPIWNASVSKFVMLKRGEIKLAANDILNRNIGINRSADVNFLREERIYSLGQYFMMSFTYSLTPLGGRGPMGGGIRIMR